MSDLYEQLKHPTWEINDSSKIKTYLDCPRKYFYEYVLGWAPDYPRHDLEFGEAWHKAMEVFYLYGFSDDALQLAKAKFIEHYRKFFDENTDMDYAPKSPGNAMLALEEYRGKYADDSTRFKILHVEVAGSVLLTPEHSIYYRLDTALEDKESGAISFLEHKTTKRLGRQWLDQWSLSIQLGTYCHVLYSLYGLERVYGGTVNGVAFQKKGNEFVRVPVRKTPDSMNVWHWSTCFWLDQLHQQYELLKKCSPKDTIMEAFPLNPESCTKYWGCPFHDFCTSWPNPLQRCEEPPLGYVEYRWDPSARESHEVINIGILSTEEE